jgi:hypothetical protein
MAAAPSLLGRFSAWLGKLSSAKPPVPPASVLLMRHGEKSGRKNDVHLNARGQARADALPSLFPAVFPAPHFIFATAATANSNRPAETVMPLAKMLRLPVNSRFANDEYWLLVRELLTNEIYSAKNVLICWHHRKIPLMAVALGVTETLPPWTEGQFDRIWRIEFSGRTAALSNLPQHLVPGDSAT